jgi:hypothetical protein
LRVLVLVRVADEECLTEMASEGAFNLARIIQVIEVIDFIRIFSFGRVIFLGIPDSGCAWKSI